MGDGNKARRRRREGGRVSGQRSPSVWDPGCGRSCSGKAARDTAELEGGVQRGPVGSNLRLDVKLGGSPPLAWCLDQRQWTQQGKLQGGHHNKPGGTGKEGPQSLAEYLGSRREVEP